MARAEGPVTRLRRWWCARQHDRGYRLHSWEMLYDGKGSIRCRRCGVVREDMGLPSFFNASTHDLDAVMEGEMAKYRDEGLFW